MASGDGTGTKEKSTEPKDEAAVDETKKEADVTKKEADVGPELTVKHPLQNKWAWWFYKNDKNKSWEANLRLVTTFDTVEDFWAIFNHIKNAGKLQPGCDYSVFKDGIKPMWEDDRNKRGGRWLISSNRNQRQELDRIWLETLLCLIGEAFDEHSDSVCGTVVQIRPKMDKLAVWTGDSKNQEATVHIGKVFKERARLPSKQSIGFQSHSDTMVKTGSTTKNLFTV